MALLMKRKLCEHILNYGDLWLKKKKIDENCHFWDGIIKDS